MDSQIEAPIPIQISDAYVGWAAANAENRIRNERGRGKLTGGMPNTKTGWT